MKIKSILLCNFQAHSKLKIDFTNGINVLVGKSGVGKSCIRRAIDYCLFNKKVDGVRKEGTKQTSVIITLDNNVVIERVRSASINRYILRTDSGEKTFDSVAKSIPKEIRDAIGVYPIEVDGEELWLNSAPQIALPFLFDKSPTWRMKLFNKLSGNDLLDKLFVQFNKDILRIGRGHKGDTERLAILSKELTAKEIEKEQLEAIHKFVKKQIEILQEKQLKYDKYMKLLELQQNNEKALKVLNDQKTEVKFPKDTEIKELTAKIDKLDILKNLLRAVLSNSADISRVSSELSSIVLPELNSEQMAIKIDRLATIKMLYKDICAVCKQKGIVMDKIVNTDDNLRDYDKTLNELIDNLDECPTCGQIVDENCKKGLKLC